MIDILRSTLDASGTPAGAIVIRSGQLTIAEGTRIISDTSAKGAAPAISLGAREALVLVQSEIASSATSNAADADGPQGAAIAIDANTVSIRESLINTNKMGEGKGAGGEISITSNGAISIANTEVLSYTTAAGSGGAVRIKGDSVEITESATIASLSDGQGGSISIGAQQLSLDGGAQVSTSSSSGAVAGTLMIDIDPGSATIAGAGTRLSTTPGMSTVPGGSGGDLIAEFGSLLLTRGARIQTGSFGGGTGGHLSISAKDGTIVIAEGRACRAKRLRRR